MKEMPRTFLSALLLLFLAVGNLVPHTIALAVSAATNDSASNNPGSARRNFRDKGLILVKIGCLIIAFCGTFLGGISPYFYRWNDAFLVLGTQFAGGVFLGTALMHFLKDANSAFEDLTEKKYPFAFMLATAGYLLTLYGDCLIQWIFAKEVAAGHVDVEKGGRKPASSQERRDGRDNKSSKANGVEGSSENIEKDLPNDMMKASQGDICSCCGENLDDCGCEEQVVDPVVVRSTVKATLIRTTSFGDSILLIVALCFHSVFEGIAIGIAETKTDAWKALWTISLHKIFAAIAMGIALLRMIPNRPLLSCAAYSFFFGISSPVGVAIGIIIDDTSEGSIADWTFAISMGLACGVFVYVSVNHLLGKGYVPPCQIAVDTPFHKLLAVVLGAALIAVVMIWDT